MSETNQEFRMNVVHLVADTNLFFECKALEQLPWSELGYDEIVLLLTKPVLDEIDKHKKSSGRTRARALEIFGRIRGMLTAETKEVEIQSSAPRVLLRSHSSAKPDPNLKDELDYGKTDEKLVGIVSMLSSSAEGYEVKLFTDDTGPAMTAADFGVPFLMISPDWRRPSAETPEDKRIKELEKENALYRSQEPKIEIGKCDVANEQGHILVKRLVAVPLTTEEVETLVEDLRAKHPLVEDFLPPPNKVTKDWQGVVTTVEYSSPSQEKLEKYRKIDYPNWLDRCREALRTIHQGRDLIEAPVLVRWPMVNTGTRPASQVRIEFEAKGPLALRRIIDEDDSDDEGDEEIVETIEAVSPARLPSPPKPPPFEEKITRTDPPPVTSTKPNSDLAALIASGLPPDRGAALARAAAGMLGPTDRLSQQLKELSSLGGLAALKHTDLFGSQNSAFRPVARTSPVLLDPLPRSSIADFASRIPGPRDPERFYYDWPKDEDVKEGALTCNLWRHHSEVEIFDFEVVFTGEDAARGTVECTVHADNLTVPARARLVVSRQIESLSMLETAKALVDACD
ncbi:PIN domain-containing protein [Allorhizobium undicola]|uniref:PIN domain-containing protein n=1 Tax=Allorhizobium undicola TaxID=78527 RepID=UPI003D33F127